MKNQQTELSDKTKRTLLIWAWVLSGTFWPIVALIVIKIPCLIYLAFGIGFILYVAVLSLGFRWIIKKN